MRLKKLSTLLYITSIIVFVGCGEDYKWDTNNVSPLEGKYETRDKTLDVNQSQQNKIVESEAQNLFYGNKNAIGLIINVLHKDDTSETYTYGCAKLKSEVKATGTLTYTTGHQENCEEPLLSTHRMKLGSLTKTTVARTILDLDDDTQYDFSIDDAISKHLPENIRALSNLSGITVRDLLFHTSGFNEIDFQPGTAEEVLKKALARTRLGEPGQYYKYNNTGYILLGEIIKEVTNNPAWETPVMERLNSVLTTHNFIFPERDNENWIQTSDTQWMTGKSNTLLDGNYTLANSYLRLPEGGFVDVTLDKTPNIAHSAGSIIGTIPDFSKWMKELVSNRSGLLSTDYFNEQVIEKHFGDDYISHLTWNMGPGLGFEQQENSYFHLGAVTGYNCMSIYSKNEEVVITVCVNGSASLTELPFEILAKMYPYRKHYLPSSTTAQH
jgi:CubicO group peptidase (beta-lactamase class C family)